MRFVRGLLLLLISEHWYEKKSSNPSALCLKSEIKPLLWNNGVSVVFSNSLRIFSLMTSENLKFFRILQLTSHSVLVFFFPGFDGVI